MKLSEEQVKKIAQLANLNLSPEEVQHMAHDMGEVLTHMEQLESLDTTGVPAMAQVLYEAGETATLRVDEEREARRLGTQKALSNAPLSGAGHFKVPKVIER